MAQQTISNIDELLKTVYHDGIVNQLNEATTIYNLFMRDNQDIEGKSLTANFNTKYRHNQGVGWRDESESLPNAGRPLYKQGTVTLKYLYGAVDFTAQALRTARSSIGAFANLLQDSLEDLTTEMQLEIERQILGYGAGDLCRFNHTSATGIAANTAIGIDTPGSQVLEEGMIIEAWSARSAGTQETGIDESTGNNYITISAVDAKANTIKFGVQSRVTDNYFLFRTDGTTSSRGKAMMGLRGVLDSTAVSTLHGINRSSGNYEWFKATEIAEAGAGLSLTKLQGYVEDAFTFGGGVVDCVLTGFTQRQKFMNLFVGDRRYGPTEELINGMTYTTYQTGNRKLPIIVSRFIADDELMMLQKDTFKIHEDGFDWITSDDDRGDVLTRSPNLHEYTAYMYNWLNLSCKAPNRNVRVTGLAT